MPFLDNEVYYSYGCRGIPDRLQHGENSYYVYFRNCVCGGQPNMPGLLPNGNINLNGIDIHENASCHYERTLQVSGEKQFNLKCYCIVTARKGKEAYDIECMFTQNCYILSIFQILIGSTKIMLFYNRKDICNIIFFLNQIDNMKFVNTQTL